MCEQCYQLQNQYRTIAERLTAAQRVLATYDLGRDGDTFVSLWNESQSALKLLRSLREEMARHAAAHLAGSRTIHT
jgi:hypothetical protein